MDLDELEGIRSELYDLQDRLDKVMQSDGRHGIRLMHHYTGMVIEYADDLRIDLMDEEDAAEDLFMKQQEADDLGDAKLEEQRSER